MAFVEGFLMGLGTIIFMGPVFFTLLQVTLQRGVKDGLSVALGIISSDILIVTLFYIGFIDYFRQSNVQFWFAVIGSLILLSLGLKFLLKPNTSYSESTDSSLKKNSNAYMKGFVVNFVNPFVFVIWVSIMALAKGRFSSETDVGIFLFAMLLGIFSTDVLKVLLAHKLRTILKPALMRKFFYIIGLVLIGFAFRLIYFVVNQL